MGLAQIANVDLQVVLDKAAIGMQLGYNPQQIFYVHSSGSSSNDGLSAAGPKATLAQALDLCTSNKAHVIYVLAGHTETLATSSQGIALSKSGVAIVGQGNGRSRPAITCGAADIDGVVLSGNSNLIRNLRFIGSTSQTTTSSVILHVSGTDNVVDSCVFEHGGAGPLGCIELAAAHRTQILNCKGLGTAAGPDFFLKTTGTAAPSNDVIIRNLDLQYLSSGDLDSCAIVCTNTTGTPGWIIQNVVGVGMGVGLLDINGSAQATTYDSIATNCYASCVAGTSTAACWDLGGMMLTDSFWSDATAAPAMWTGVGLRVAGTTGTVGAYPTAAGPS